jgi:cytochrome b6-f complex iron-sulfur subunit
MDDPTLGGDQPDTPAADDSVQGTGFMMCGAQLCVDLTHPQNAALTMVNGFRQITMGATRVAIVRTSDTEFATVNARCTHAGCAVSQFQSGTQRLRCPCHGSQFNTDGTVAMGPAAAPLPVLTNTFSGTTLMIDI